MSEKETNRRLKFFKIRYPGIIGLDDYSKFFMKIDGETFFVKIKDKELSLVVRDFNNSFKINNKIKKKEHVNIELARDLTPSLAKDGEVLQNKEFYFLLEKRTDRPRAIYNMYYTTLYLKFEVNNFMDNIETENKLWKYLNHFLTQYKRATRDSKIQIRNSHHSDSILFYEKTLSYSDISIDLPIERRLDSPEHHGILKFPLSRLSLSTFGRNFSLTEYDIAKNTAEFKTYIGSLKSEENEINQIDLLLKSKEELFHNRNFKYSFLDSFIFIESIISKAIFDEKIKRGISKKKLNEYKMNIGIGYAINVELPLLFPEKFENKETIVQDLNSIRKIRNKIVHVGIDIAQERAEFCIKVAEEIYDLFKE